MTKNKNPKIHVPALIPAQTNKKRQVLVSLNDKEGRFKGFCQHENINKTLTKHPELKVFKRWQKQNKYEETLNKYRF